MKLTVLNCGTPTPRPNRFGSSYLLDVAGTRVLFDCGPATTFKLAQAGIDVQTVHRLFFTHHHFDHNADYGCFILSRWDQRGDEYGELSVRGPAPTSRITERLIGPDGAFVDDWRARIGHPTSQQVYANRGGRLPRRPPVVRTEELSPGEEVDEGSWTVRTARAEHVQPYLDSLAYRVDSAEGSVVFTGDTEPCPSVSELARGCDLMVCMCWADEATLQRSGEATAQCGTLGAATMAEQAQVERLLLVHLGDSVSSAAQQSSAVEEMSRVYGGRIEFGSELQILQV